eukprot:m.299469 g.299469  ORF g.299469 m.299469 type:complete len:131 (-) comp16415_c0_seq2:1038-1430(-)
MWERGSEFLFTAQETTARNTLETTNVYTVNIIIFIFLCSVFVQDESIDLLRSTIETPAAGQEHVKEKGPITWLCVRDQLVALSKNKLRISFSEVEIFSEKQGNGGMGQVKDLSIQLEVKQIPPNWSMYLV